MARIFHLVYISEASEDISYTDIQNILTVSRENNLQTGVTGILIYRDGYFLQLLEGDESIIVNLVNKIRFDKRNTNLRVLIEANGEERLFEGWAMAFCDGDLATNNTEHLVALFESCSNAVEQQRFLIMPFLKKFRASGPQLK